MVSISCLICCNPLPRDKRIRNYRRKCCRCGAYEYFFLYRVSSKWRVSVQYLCRCDSVIQTKSLYTFHSVLCLLCRDGRQFILYTVKRTVRNGVLLIRCGCFSFDASHIAESRRIHTARVIECSSSCSNELYKLFYFNLPVLIVKCLFFSVLPNVDLFYFLSVVFSYFFSLLLIYSYKASDSRIFFTKYKIYIHPSLFSDC